MKYICVKTTCVEGGVMLASVLGSLAALASMAVTLALCYLFWRKRSAAKEAKDELEPLQVGVPTPNQGTPNKGAQQGNKSNNKSVVELTRHNVEDRLYQGAVAAASSLSLDRIATTFLRYSV
ncbi:unnamed protein product [Larinioides sclopetarius]|uniref:Uncharacterized protein n=2 Tax=Larinioides sclopetarius TaxID=280406 RepID=A0AAV1ZJL9_9ARAC